VYITAGPETGKKIASIGIRIRRGASYHGLAFNVTDEALPNFQRINPCGYAGLEVTSVQRTLPKERGPADMARVAADLEPHLMRELRL
jgi:lipoyl(octanoyl) transferase